MKRLVILLCIVATMFLTSCAHFYDGTSVWSGGLWIIPAIIAIGFFICAYRAWTAYNSGTVSGGGYPYGPTKDEPGKPPMNKNGWLWFAVILFVAFWVIVYVVNHGR